MKSELWQRLKAARDYSDKRQEDIAKACGVSRGAVALWERHIPEKRTRPDIRQIQVIAKETGIPVDWLLNDAADPSDVWRVGAEAKKMSAPPVAQPVGALDMFARAVEFEIMQTAPHLLSGFSTAVGPVRVDFAWGKHLVVFAQGEDHDKLGRLLVAERLRGTPAQKHLFVWQKSDDLTPLPSLFGIESVLVASPADAAKQLIAIVEQQNA